MDLELKTASLDAYETGGDLALTQEETAETIVPDYCPDIARIMDEYHFRTVMAYQFPALLADGIRHDNHRAVTPDRPD